MDAIAKKNKRLIITAIAVNNAGDVLFDLFIAWGLSAATGNFMNAVYVVGTSVAFRAILAFFMGAFVDRHPKKKLIILSHLSSIVVIAVFGLVWELAKEFVVIGIGFVLINDINNELFSRSYISMTAELFNENEYIKFQSVSNITVRIVSIAGAAIAGVLLASVPDYAIFLIDIATYVGALLFVLQVKYRETYAFQKKGGIHLVKTILDDTRYTFRHIVGSPYLLTFIILMFLLNLAYGYIPQVLPIFKANLVGSATLLGMIKSALTVGEIIGLAIVNRCSRYVSRTFKWSMLANMLLLLLVCLTQNPLLLLLLFALYGLFDSLTQPLFGYTVSRLDSQNRGKLLGGIDAMIMFSPSIGIYALSALANYSEILSGVAVSLIFLTGFLIVFFNKNINHIVLEKP